MRILHTSDWHLGITLQGVSLLCEQQRFIDLLPDIIAKNKVGAVIVSGDIFDSSVSSSDAISLYNRAATCICKDLKLPMIVIAGNHDGAARLSSMHELLSSCGLFVSGRLTRPVMPVILDDAAVYPVPYFNLDEVRALYPEKEIKTYESAFCTVCDDIRSGMNRALKNIVAAHAFVSGAALSSSDKSAAVGPASMVSASVFDGFAYTALGHLHRPQSINAAVRYSGSPIKYSFSEANFDKSVTIYDTESASIETPQITPLCDMRVIRGSYSDVSDIKNSTDDFVKLEITDRFAGIEMLETLRGIYPNLLAVSGKSAETEADCVTLTVDEVKNLSPQDIVSRFFTEMFDSAPEPQQLELYLSALEKAQNGGDAS